MRNGQIRRMAALAAAVWLLAGCGDKEQYLKRADQYLGQEEYGLALDNYNKAIMEDENLQLAYRGAGIASLQLADYVTAEDMFLRALKESDGVIGKTELDLSYYLGETQICLGKYEEAVECYSNIIEYDEEEQSAYFYRGSAYLQLDQTDKADKDFKKASQNADAALLYGIYEAYEGRGSDAGRAYLEQIIQKKDSTEEEAYVQGKAYYKLGDEERARELLIKSGEKEPQALFYLGSICEQQGDYEAAVGYYNAYKDKEGLSFAEYRTVSECMMKMGDYPAAVELNHAVKERAGNAEAQDLAFEEIVLYERSGDFASARAAAESYVQQYPEDAGGIREYEFLQTR